MSGILFLPEWCDPLRRHQLQTSRRQLWCPKSTAARRCLPAGSCELRLHLLGCWPCIAYEMREIAELIRINMDSSHRARFEL